MISVRDHTRTLVSPRITESAWPRLALRERWSGVEEPSCLAHAGDGTGHLYISERRGLIRLMERGRVHDEPFLDLTDRVGARPPGGGMRTVCFRSSPGLGPISLFAAYTGRDRRWRLSEFELDGGRPREERVLLEADASGLTAAHGPDDRLYVALGRTREGGGALLRYDGVSTGNGSTPVWEACFEGLECPRGLAFDRLTGELYLTDHMETEERVLYASCAPRGGQPAEEPRMLAQAAVHHHSEGAGLVGGRVYRGRSHPSLHGMYLYADESTGEIRGLRLRADGGWEQRSLAKTLARPLGLWEDEHGEVYVTVREGGVFELAAVEEATF